MGKKKDFDLEKIDKILAQFPDEGETEADSGNAQPKKALKPASKPQPAIQHGQTKPTRKRPVIGTWTRVVAGLVLAGAITQWPYGNSCGIGLFLYMIAIGGVLAVGVWAAVHTWHAHLHVPHLLSLAIVLWAAGIGLFQVLPRIGYAKTGAAWLCAVQSAEPVPATGPATPAQQPGATSSAETPLAADSATTDSTLPADTSAPTDSIPAADTAAADSVATAVPDTAAVADPDTVGGSE